MDERLSGYVKVVSALEGDDISEEMKLVETEDSSGEYDIEGWDFVDAVSVGGDFAVLDYEFPEFANIIAEIVSGVEQLADTESSYTSGHLDDNVFDIDTEIEPFRSHTEGSYRAETDLEEVSISLEYGERTSYGFGGSETAKLALNVEGDLDFEYNNTWNIH